MDKTVGVNLIDFLEYGTVNKTALGVPSLIREQTNGKLMFIKCWPQEIDCLRVISNIDKPTHNKKYWENNPIND